jgi:hypothetical protein
VDRNPAFDWRRGALFAALLAGATVLSVALDP